MTDKHITSTKRPEKAYVYSPFISDKASCGPTAAHFCAYFGQTAQERAAEWPVALFLLLRNFTLRPASGSAPPLHSSFALRLAQFRYRSLTPLGSGDAYVPLVAATKHLCGSRSRAAASACAARPPVRFLSVRHSGVCKVYVVGPRKFPGTWTRTSASTAVRRQPFSLSQLTEIAIAPMIATVCQVLSNVD